MGDGSFVHNEMSKNIIITVLPQETMNNTSRDSLRREREREGIDFLFFFNIFLEMVRRREGTGEYG